MTAPRPVVLASASPRRQELLRLLVRDFEIVPSNSEEVHAEGCPPESAAIAVAVTKAMTVLARRPEAVVLGADTIVYRLEHDRAVLYGKPADAEDACRMLRELSGRSHEVVTGVAVVWSASEGSVRGRVESVTTHVWFRKLSEEEIKSYVATGEPLDKAGAYGIQERAAAFVERVEGDYLNVVGLSLSAAKRLLRGLVPELGRLPKRPKLPFPVVPR